MSFFASLVPAVAGFASSIIGGNAQKKAIRAGQETIQQGKAEAFDALDTGADTASGYVAPLVGPGDDARGYIRSVMGRNPADLTPSQKIAIDDTMRQTKQGLAAGGLRGAGRAGVAVLGDVMNRATSRAFDTNQGRSDRAAATLEGRGAQARGNLAQIEQQRGVSKAGSATGTATQLSRLDTAIGTANAAMASDAGDAVAAATPGVVDLLGSLRSAEKRDQYA